MYKIRKTGSMYEVVSTSSGIVQFSSLHRYRCTEWIISNFPETVEAA